MIRSGTCRALLTLKLLTGEIQWLFGKTYGASDESTWATLVQQSYNVSSVCRHTEALVWISVASIRGLNDAICMTAGVAPGLWRYVLGCRRCGRRCGRHPRLDRSFDEDNYSHTDEKLRDLLKTTLEDRTQESRNPTASKLWCLRAIAGSAFESHCLCKVFLEVYF